MGSVDNTEKSNSHETTEVGSSFHHLAWLVGIFAASVFVCQWSNQIAWQMVAGIAISFSAVILLRQSLRFLSMEPTAHADAASQSWLWTAIWTVAAVTLFASFAFAAGLWSGGPIAVFDRSPAHWLLIKLPVVTLQQIALCWMLWPSICMCTRRRVLSIALTAILFAALHFPNPLLMCLTLVGGVAWLTLFVRFRRVVPLIASHFVLAVSIAALGGEFMLNMRVGQSCADLFPAQVPGVQQRMTVLPHVVQGCIDEFLEDPQSIVLRGFARDVIYSGTPTQFVLVDSDAGIWIPCTDVRQSHSPTTSDSRSQPRFELTIKKEQMGAGRSWRLYAANRNGYFSQLGTNGPIEMHYPCVPVQLRHFPITMDGRIDTWTETAMEISVSGWIADFQAKTTTHRLGLTVDGRPQIVAIDSARIPRSDIADVADSNDLLMSGFSVSVPIPRPPGTQIQFFAVDNRDVWHPLPVTPDLAESLADRTPHYSPFVRR